MGCLSARRKQESRGAAVAEPMRACGWITSEILKFSLLNSTQIKVVETTIRCGIVPSYHCGPTVATWEPLRSAVWDSGGGEGFAEWGFLYSTAGVRSFARSLVRLLPTQQHSRAVHSRRRWSYNKIDSRPKEQLPLTTEKERELCSIVWRAIFQSKLPKSLLLLPGKSPSCCQHCSLGCRVNTVIA